MIPEISIPVICFMSGFVSCCIVPDLGSAGFCTATDGFSALFAESAESGSKELLSLDDALSISPESRVSSSCLSFSILYKNIISLCALFIESSTVSEYSFIAIILEFASFSRLRFVSSCFCVISSSKASLKSFLAAVTSFSVIIFSSSALISAILSKSLCESLSFTIKLPIRKTTPMMMRVISNVVI